MKTETVTILALMVTMVAYGVIHYFKYKQLKRYYKRMVSKNNELMDSIVEKDERINQLSNQLTDMFQEDKRKNAKILAKNVEIQQLKEQAK
jgi:uncharacterized HAD superfamily protein